MKNTIFLLVLITLSSCYPTHYGYSYQPRQNQAHVAKSVTTYETKTVLISHDGGKTYIATTVLVITNNQQQQQAVTEYWRQTPQWLGSPERAYVETGGMFGQYLFQSGVRVYLNGKLIKI